MNQLLVKSFRGRAKRSLAFTLVELLVVIGIIAILISILLPVISRARKQANTVKCAAALREIAHCLTMYSKDNRDRYPVVKYDTNPATVLATLPDGTSITAFYWSDFLLKYTTKGDYYLQGSASGAGAGGTDRFDRSKKNIFRGCPEYSGSFWTNVSTKAGGESYSESGYGYNIFPMWNSATRVADYSTGPVYKNSIGMDSFVNSIQNGNRAWHSFKDFHPSAEKCVVIESTLWLFWMTPTDPATHLVEREPGPSTAAQGAFAYFTGGWSNIDRYRHGVYPKVLADGTFDDKVGGRVAYNILYADGHVQTALSIADGFHAMQGRDP